MYVFLHNDKRNEWEPRKQEWIIITKDILNIVLIYINILIYAFINDYINNLFYI